VWLYEKIGVQEDNSTYTMVSIVSSIGNNNVLLQQYWYYIKKKKQKLETIRRIIIYIW